MCVLTSLCVQHDDGHHLALVHEDKKIWFDIHGCVYPELQLLVATSTHKVTPLWLGSTCTQWDSAGGIPVITHAASREGVKPLV